MGSPGVENVRWKIPVRPDDTIRVRAQVIESRPSSTRPEVGIIRWRWRVLNQHDECVTEIESTGMFQRRPDGSALGTVEVVSEFDAAL